MMQLYWIPVLTACLSLLLANTRGMRSSRVIALSLALTNIIGMAVLITTYRGINSDWTVYRDFVKNCREIRCTYFEPGYDLLTYVSSETFGFGLIKFFILLSFIASVAIVKHGSARQLIGIVATASVTVGALPLMLGAIRQSLTLPLLLWAAMLLSERRYRSMLITLGLACLIHYSALIVGFWYGLFWYLHVIKSGERKAGFLRTLALIFGTYSALYIIKSSGFGETYVLVSRIGETGVGTDAISTGGFIRDLAILAERISFSIVALLMLHSQKSNTSPSVIERIFFLMYIAGTAFFISTYEFDRNIAGRTLATFRLADAFVVMTAVQYLLRGALNKIATFGALVVAICFVIGKSYITLTTVGFFNE